MSMTPVRAADDWASSAPTILGAVARSWYAVAALTLAAVVVGFVASSVSTSVYTATATVYVAEREDAFDPERQVQEVASRIDARSVFERASRRLDGALDSRAIEEQTTIDADDAVGIITVSANSTEPAMAAQIANAVTRAYRQQARAAVTARLNDVDDLVTAQQSDLTQQINRLQRRLDQQPNDAEAQRELEALQSQLLVIQDRVAEVVADAAIYGTGIDRVEPAIAPEEPSRPRPLRTAAVAGMLGLGLAVAGAYWRAVVVARATVDPSTLLGAPLLAQIPELRRAGQSGEPLFDHEAVEAYQFLVSSFDNVIDQTAARSVLITSPSPGDGKSLTALHLARALAIQGRNVVLVDADIRARGLSSLLDAGGHQGLVELAEGAALHEVTREYQISHAVDLTVVPAGRTPPQPTGLLATSRYRNAIASIVARTDLTIIDGGPLLTVADSFAIANQVAAMLLVIDARTPDDDLRQVQQRLRLVPTPLVGFVVNRAHERKPPEAYGQAPEPRGFAALWDRMRGMPASTRGAESDTA